MTPPPSTTTNGNCHWTVPKNSVFTVRQTPDAGFVFNGWSGSCSGTNIACTVVMDDDHDVGATWSESGTQQVLDGQHLWSGNGHRRRNQLHRSGGLYQERAFRLDDHAARAAEGRLHVQHLGRLLRRRRRHLHDDDGRSTVA